jgi:outer membrane lipoprotein-sorting protein
MVLKSFATFLLFILPLFANEAQDIIDRVDANMRGKDLTMTITMTISSMGHKRVMKMRSYSEGTKKSFIKILYPPKERGITFLSLNNQMWQYVPKIERIIKIPPSMMLQNWMGSDITNDDMVKQSSIIDDYLPKILNKNAEIVTLELTPKENAPVVWGKIISDINTTTYTSKRDTFYDEDGNEVRYFIYDKVKKFGKYYIPTYWLVQSKSKKNNTTQMSLSEITYDSNLSEKYFQKSALTRFSR